MALVTQNLSFGVTVNLSYEQPYQFARRFASLDHLTQGRLGWNIVTGYLDSAERLIGQKGLKDHDARYDQAEEFLQLCYQYWEGSWENDALKKISNSAFLLIPIKSTRSIIKGNITKAKVFQVAPSVQRTPTLFQAGASPKGLQFATRHAECIFIGGDQPEKIRQQVNKIRLQAQQQGRDEDAIKIFVGITVVVAETHELAQQKLAEYRQYASPEAGLAHYASSVGIDLAKFADDEAIPYQKSNSIASVNEKFKEQRISKNDLKAQHVLGGRYPLIVGSGAEVAEYLIELLDQTGIDGFNLTRTVAPESHHDFIRLVIPELQQRGRYKTEYATGSLRNKLFAQGDHLAASHPADQFRCRTHNNADDLKIIEEISA
jgi:FMN-dependent oxidoreductase (nitrilotriacetate monooxygenase family)